MSLTYQDAIQYLYTQLPMFSVVGAGAYKPGLQTAVTLAEAFGNPQNNFRSIHVGGTNGKGSTSHTLASILMASGLKVGLFTSPHMFDFRERIRVNGQMIDEQYVVDFVERYHSMDLDVAPSFFELTTIMAFEYFSRCNVDIAVVEVGLGGRLDTTNIITPILSVITNISMDHMAQLGDSETAIATEKAGIIKPGVPVVIGESSGVIRQVFIETTDRVGAPIVLADDTPVDYRMVDDHYVYSRSPDGPVVYDSDLQGVFQPRNINTVMHALEFLPRITDEALAKGLANVQSTTGLMGRWMVVRESGPRIICDTGHNIGAWRVLAPRLKEIADNGRLELLLGFVEDKDIEPIIELLPQNGTYYFVTPPTKRGRPAASLKALCDKRGLHSTAFDAVEAGMSQAMADATQQTTIFVGGSNYIFSDLKHSIGIDTQI